MTPERLRELRASLVGQTDRDKALELLAEVDRLRALPAIATCGECRWCHPSAVCMHERAHAEYEIDGRAMPPPSRCRLRGKR